MRNRAIAVSAVFLQVLFLISISVAGADRGVTDTEIRVGQWGPQTGPVALWGRGGAGERVLF